MVRRGDRQPNTCMTPSQEVTRCLHLKRCAFYSLQEQLLQQAQGPPWDKALEVSGPIQLHKV